MTKTILLTGSTGFVGRQILKSLLAQSAKVKLLVRIGKEDEILTSANIEAVITTPDLLTMSQESWEDICTDIDTVVHAAWYTEPGEYLQSSKNIDFLNSTLLLAKACVKNKVRRFVGIGTCFEYDLQAGYLSVDTPIKPSSLYASAKASTFLLLSQFFNVAKVEFAWCRLFYLYGEGEDSRRFVPYLRAKLAASEIAEITDGNQVRDYMDVSEAGRMIVDVAQSCYIGAVNICSGKPITIRKFAEIIADEYGRRDLLKFGARERNTVDPPCVVGVR